MIRCITIDDEPLALKQMAEYITKTPYLEFVGAFENAIDALSFLQTNEVDLMFVDINMPDLNGMEFVKSLQNPPKVIFSTAYSDYALEGFKVDAIDYIVKPIGYSDFLKASDKAKNRLTPDSLSVNEDFLFIKSEYKVLRINVSEINYIEGMREYIRIYLDGKEPVMTLMSIKKIVEQLPSNRFMRVHRSFVVNLNKITAIERNRIIFGKEYIPISDQYKVQFHDFLNNNFLK